ncbi:MAG TPA: hypothetical protein PLH93_10345 [Flavobacteriales bacterium]|nr:hypothetical protein [Flavobacteriales bacterium]HQW87577.1 hypothetical protein [Flavobacteriales bacterium]
MMIQVEHEDEDTRIEVLPDQRLVRLTWKRPVSGAMYRGSLLRLLNTVTLRHLKHWLSDGRRMGPILYADQAWTLEEFVPQLVKAGVERIAIVSSEDVLNQIAVDRMVSATAAVVPYNIAFFQDPSIAQLWLMDKGSSPAIAGA